MNRSVKTTAADAFPRVQLTVLQVGYCVHPECLALRGGRWKLAAFPALVGLIRHRSAGAILFDTGYSEHFLHATAQLPERLYRWTTPMTLPEEQCLQAQLARNGVAMHEVRAVFASHLHADHIAGLRDLPRSALWCSAAALIHARRMHRFARLRKATLLALLPDDIDVRFRSIESQGKQTLPGRWAMLGEGYDLIGDGSLWAVPLPGHARGHMGLLLRHEDDREWLLAGDAAWHIDELREHRAPAWPTRILVDDWAAHHTTRASLHALLAEAQRERDDSIAMLPAHCAHSFEALPPSMHSAGVVMQHDAVIETPAGAGA